MRRVNVFSPHLDHESDREGHRWRGARVGKQLGSSRIGASLYQLDDGERLYAFHLHHGMEEWALVVDGMPVTSFASPRARAAPISFAARGQC
jgi:uncharacterized cupin superfamily protein